MYGSDDIYNAPTSMAKVTADHIGDAVSEAFGRESAHKNKKGRIAKITQKLMEMIQKEKFGFVPLLLLAGGAVLTGGASLLAFAKKKDLHGLSEKLAKVVEKLQDKEADWEPEENTVAFVAYGNSDGGAEALRDLLVALHLGEDAPDAGASDDGGLAASGGDVTRPGDAAFYQAPAEGAYQYNDGPTGPGYDQGYDQGYGPVGDTYNTYNYGDRPSHRPLSPREQAHHNKKLGMGRKDGQSSSSSASRPSTQKPKKQPSVFQKLGLGGGGKTSSSSSSRPSTPSRAGAGHSRPTSSASKTRPSGGKVSFKPAIKTAGKVISAPVRLMAKGASAAGKALGGAFKKGKFGALGSLDTMSRQELFGDMATGTDVPMDAILNSEEEYGEISRMDLFGAEALLGVDAFRPTMGQSSISHSKLFDDTVDEDIENLLGDDDEAFGGSIPDDEAAALNDAISFSSSTPTSQESLPVDEDDEGSPDDFDAPSSNDVAPPSGKRTKVDRQEGRIGKSGLLHRKDIEKHIDVLGKKYEHARKVGDASKMKEFSRLHSAAVSAYRESQKEPELQTRQHALMGTERMGAAWAY
jgi:hypothetical protein